MRERVPLVIKLILDTATILSMRFKSIDADLPSKRRQIHQLNVKITTNPALLDWGEKS